MQQGSCQKLREELKAIKAGLQEVVELLTCEDNQPVKQLQLHPDAGQDFFEQIIHQDDLPEDEELLFRVLSLIIELGYASTIVLQHRLEINYRQAASIIANFERAGLIEPAHGFRPHKVLPAAHAVYERLGQEQSELEFVK